MYAVLHVPGFRLQAVLRFRPADARAPLALVDAAGRRSVVVDVNAAARRAGVGIGLSSAQALARCAALALLPREPAQEEAARTVLLQTAAALAPEIEDTAEGLCTLRFHLPASHDWEETGRQALAVLESLGLLARAGFGPNPDLALLAARRARRVQVVREPEAFLADLPVDELSPSAGLLAVLDDWGIRTVGQLRALSRGGLADRLGPEAVRLHELACGTVVRPLDPVRPPEEFVESFDFEQEIETLEPLLFLLRRFLDQLTRRLRGMWRVAGRMILTLPLENGGVYGRAFTIPCPSADPGVLFRILSTALESLRLEHRPRGVRLRMEPAAVAGDQLQLFESALRDPNRFGETLARLAALAGPASAGSIRLLDTHRPDSWETVAPRFQGSLPEVPDGRPGVGLPLRRLRPPPPAAVRTTRQRPVHVESPAAGGPVRDALGPYRLSGQWWDRQSWVREEWDVELADGSLLRLAREPDGWRLDGYYDLPVPAVRARNVTGIPPRIFRENAERDTGGTGGGASG